MLDFNDITWMLSQGFFQRALIGGICAAVLCSVLGVFIVLRRQSLIGEGMWPTWRSAVSPPGSSSPYIHLYMALVFALFGTIAISLPPEEEDRVLGNGDRDTVLPGAGPGRRAGKPRRGVQRRPLRLPVRFHPDRLRRATSRSSWCWRRWSSASPYCSTRSCCT
jgi:hypothetical protein